MKTWTVLVQPIVEKCEVVSALNMEVCWNAEGARALGSTLKEMARLLDGELIPLVSRRCFASGFTLGVCFGMLSLGAVIVGVTQLGRF